MSIKNSTSLRSAQDDTREAKIKTLRLPPEGGLLATLCRSHSLFVYRRSNLIRRLCRHPRRFALRNSTNENLPLRLIFGVSSALYTREPWLDGGGRRGIFVSVGAGGSPLWFPPPGGGLASHTTQYALFGLFVFLCITPHHTSLRMIRRDQELRSGVWRRAAAAGAHSPLYPPSTQGGPD